MPYPGRHSQKLEGHPSSILAKVQLQILCEQIVVFDIPQGGEGSPPLGLPGSQIKQGQPRHLNLQNFQIPLPFKLIKEKRNLGTKRKKKRKNKKARKKKEIP